jgi:two-component system, chemotaxis family, protein-glutamate methylesterase/glutaminase
MANGNSGKQLNDPQEQQANNTKSHNDYPIILIGASSGGLEVIRELVSRLPHDFNAAIFIVWHMAPTIFGVLPQLLNKIDKVHAAHAYDGEEIQPDRIYVAPPDRHMLIEHGKIRITRGPKENRFRPAIDPLFRSAAYAYGPLAIGIILSGALDDGTAGLWAIKHFGGIAIVQDPKEATVASMPESALREVKVDHCLPISGIAEKLLELVRGRNVVGEPQKDERVEREIDIAKEENAFERNIMKFGNLSPYTCPECHGVLTALHDGTIERYRCHTGHAFSADTLLSAVSESVEESIYSAIRGMDECIILLNHMGDHLAEKNEMKLAASYFKKAQQTNERATQLRKLVLNHEQLNQQNLKVDDHRHKNPGE